MFDVQIRRQYLVNTHKPTIEKRIVFISCILGDLYRLSYRSIFTIRTFCISDIKHMFTFLNFCRKNVFTITLFMITSKI